ncbi:Predicted nucleic-acid-binding protein, contains Zn-ribbon domain [Halorubrum xinjiangense]|uniref:Predicted nucleic-acid-binding protein, contains Zn-ribbon domain n=1 Tax=Halorubrum xinjiangense TaxID=261291 RepID=A0A1G7GPP5_9EURY|nr:zinc ribbon domain-containing protein [Halorubrum xinjiangense]SDE90107.1 Predicted nucleic-acid-binding protein, contains Zn-ribbon domain [Halorubrum xinjiangense]
MPSENDETKYSVFGDGESSDEWDRAADGSAGGGDAATADDRRQSLGGDGDDGCPKCGGTETETDEIATSGTGLTKMFDVQNRRFVVVSCAECGYSELYKGQSSGNAIDFFLG